MATRRERVVLELQDDFTSGMARAAAAAALLNRELDSLSRDSVRTRRSLTDIDRPVANVGRSAANSGREIDRLSGRLRLLADTATILGPALIPVGAIGVPAVAGLAAQFGFAATAAGTTILAFQGVGDALTAMNKASLEPTTKNLEDAQIALDRLAPAAQAFVEQIGDMMPALRGLRNTAQQGFFPGLTEGLGELESALPRVRNLISNVATETGSIAADTGTSLASDRWAPFLDFIADEAPSALGDMATAAGNTVHAMAEMWMAFDPLNDDFSAWLVEATESLDKWAANLSQTQGFREFVAYIRETGPQVADTFAAIGDAVLQIVEAAAPLGGPVLAGVEAFAKAVATIADSDLGTPLFTAAAALALFNRTMAVTTAARTGIGGFGGRLSAAGSQVKGFGATVRTVRDDLALWGTTAMTAGARTQREMARTSAAAKRLRSSLAPIGKGAGVMGGLAIASTGVADSIGLTNTASLGLAGTLAGPWGAAIGVAVGGVMDLSAALGASEGDLRRYQETLLAAAGPDLPRQLAAVTAEIEKQQRVLRDESGPSLNPLEMFPVFANSNYQTAKDRLDALKETQSELRHQIELGGLEARGASEITDTYGTVIANAGAAASTTAGQIDALVESMEAQRQEALSAFGAETRYRQALKDARTQAAKSDAGIRGDSEAAIKNRQTIEALAAAWNGQSEAVRNNSDKFREARRNFIETATAMGVPIEQARILARRLLEIPENKVIGVEFNATDALADIRRIKREMATIPTRVRTEFFVNQVNAQNKDLDGDGRPDFARGGWTGPGSKYQPAGVVHADEFVFSKEATHGNVAKLDALHRQLRGYANGGLVQSNPIVSGGAFSSVAGAAPVDIEHLAALVAQTRPLYGDVYVQPHNYSEFQRQRDADSRAAGLDGVRR